MTHRTGPKCTATCTGGRDPSKRGKPCGNPPVKGATVCGAHGGSASQVRNAGRARIAEADVRRLLDGMDIEPVTNPVPALQEIAGLVRAWVAVAREKVAELERVDVTSERGEEHVKAAVQVFERSLDRAHKVLADMVKLNLAERAQSLDEKTAAQLIDLFRAVREDVDLGLTPAQKLGFFPAVARARAALN